jgi:hypothetical protein
VLVVGAVHLQQYFAVHFGVVPVIGPLFALNFAGATLIGVGLLIPAARLRPLHVLLALGGIGLAATSFVFLLVGEQQPLFGFQDHGYRAAIVVALAAEAAAVLLLAGYLAARVGARSRGAASVGRDREPQRKGGELHARTHRSRGAGRQGHRLRGRRHP